MDYQHFSYPESMQFAAYMEEPAIEVPMDGILDPKLKRSTSPAYFADQWNAPQMQRCLTDSKKSSFFGYSVDSVLPGTVPSVPSTLLQRRDSPPYSQPSSTCSSALSPPGESDYSQTHSPDTPTDTTPLSPFSNQYESCGLHELELYQFTGMAADCVKPNDVNPYQETPHGFYEDNQGANLPIRAYSMSTDDSNINLDQCGGPEQFPLDRHLSPESFAPEIKEEIRIPETNGDYPPFEPEDDELMSGEEVEPPNLKHEDEEDEYRPNKKQKRTMSNSNRNARNRKRPSTTQPSPDAKRLKFESEDHSASKHALQSARGHFPCTECPKISFKDVNGLQTHIKKQHTRPFSCIFDFAGCNSTFASKNEWKRHCASQHLVLNYWVCQQDQCAKVANGCNSASKSPAANHSRFNLPRSHPDWTATLPNGTIFNRKDLYTQHLRRMHSPSNTKKQSKQKKALPDWEDQERAFQAAAVRTRCQLPTHMQCPAAGCNARFDGATAWDDRMEHVAKHLEKAATSTELPIKFGGENDKTLMDWATCPDVAIVRKVNKGWELRNPLKPQKANHSSRRETVADEDEDAEGELIDE